MFKKEYPYGKQSITWSDILAVVKALRSPWLTQGPAIKKFENDLCAYTGASYAVAVANGTAALHLAMLALGIKQGDEGITSPITFAASANCMHYVGARALFADIDSVTACIDPVQIKKRITPQTRVLIPVHMAGQSCDMEAIQRIAGEHNLFVVEDAAHAIGSEYKGFRVGSCQFSDMTTFSFHPVKTITTGEGGAITTNNKAFYEKLLLFRTHGITRDPSLMTRNDGSWYYQMIDLGFNYRITDIQAALGSSQLKRLDSFVRRRRQIVTRYMNGFAQDERFAYLQENNDCNSAFHLFPLLINFDRISLSKIELFKKLNEQRIFPQVHYIPVHTQPFYQRQGYALGDYPHAEKYYDQALSLPLYPGLTDRDCDYIINTVKEVAQ